MNLIPYIDVNNQQCFFDCSQVVCIMTDQPPQPPDADGNPSRPPTSLTKVMLNHRGGYIFTLESTSSISKRIMDALSIPEIKPLTLDENNAGS